MIGQCVIWFATSIPAPRAEADNHCMVMAGSSKVNVKSEESSLYMLCDHCHLRAIARNLGADLFNVARRLGLHQVAIGHISNEYKRDLHEMAFQFLRTWYLQVQSEQSEMDPVERLILVLRQEAREELVKKLTQKCHCNFEFEDL